MSVMIPISGKRFFSSRTVRGTSPLPLNASSAPAVFRLESTTGNNAIAGMPNVSACSTTGSNLSTLVRTTPGMEETSSTMLVPSRTNTGRIRSSGASRDSRTSRREKSSRRERRMRRSGKRPRLLLICKRRKSAEL
jgi:hypothetical protein